MTRRLDVPRMRRHRQREELRRLQRDGVDVSGRDVFAGPLALAEMMAAAVRPDDGGRKPKRPTREM